MNPIDLFEESSLGVRAIRVLTVVLVAVLLSVWGVSAYRWVERVRDTVEIGTLAAAR